MLEAKLVLIGSAVLLVIGAVFAERHSVRDEVMMATVIQKYQNSTIRINGLGVVRVPFDVYRRVSVGKPYDFVLRSSWCRSERVVDVRPISL